MLKEQVSLKTNFPLFFPLFLSFSFFWIVFLNRVIAVEQTVCECVCFFISLVEIYELPFRVHTFFIYIFSLYSFVYLHLLIFYAIKYQIILYIYISIFILIYTYLDFLLFFIHFFSLLFLKYAHIICYSFKRYYIPFFYF